MNMRQVLTLVTAVAAGTALFAAAQTPVSPPSVATPNSAATDGQARVQIIRLHSPAAGARLIVAAGSALVALGVNRIYARKIAVPAGQPPKDEMVHDPDIHVFDLTTGREIRTLTGHTQGVGSIAISNDGRIALSVGEDKTARAWDVATGKQIAQIEGQWVPNALALSPTGDKAYFSNLRTQEDRGLMERGTLVWDIATGQTTINPEPDIRKVAAPATLGRTGAEGGFSGPIASPDGKWVITWNGAPYGDPTPNIWEIRHADTNTVALRVAIDGSAHRPEFLPDSAGFQAFDEHLWQILRVHLPADRPGTEKAVTPKSILTWTEKITHENSFPDANQRLETSAAGDVALFHTAMLYQNGDIRPLDLQKINVKPRDIHLAQDGKRLYSIGPRSVTTYSLGDLSPNLLWSQPVTMRPVSGSYFGPDRPRELPVNNVRAVYLGDAAAYLAEVPEADSDAGQHVVFWNLLTNKSLSDISFPLVHLAIAFSRDGQFMVIFNGASCVLFKTATAQVIRTIPLLPDFPVPQGGDPAISLSNNGSIVLISAGTLSRIYDLATGARLAEISTEFHGHPRPVLSRDGSHALVLGEAGDVYLLDTRSNTWVAHFTRPTAPLTAAAFDDHDNILTTSTPVLYSPIPIPWNSPSGPSPLPNKWAASPILSTWRHPTLRTELPAHAVMLAKFRVGWGCP